MGVVSSRESEAISLRNGKEVVRRTAERLSAGLKCCPSVYEVCGGYL
ncbi:hypothetical protein LINPERPRIM_LOCUS36947 [Linum perenne]